MTKDKVNRTPSPQSPDREYVVVSPLPEVIPVPSPTNRISTPPPIAIYIPSLNSAPQQSSSTDPELTHTQEHASQETDLRNRTSGSQPLTPTKAPQKKMETSWWDNLRSWTPSLFCGRSAHAKLDDPVDSQVQMNEIKIEAPGKQANSAKNAGPEKSGCCATIMRSLGC